MAAGDPDDRRAAASREGLEDALGRLEERLDRASRAAERLLGDAAQRMTEGGGAPDAAGGAAAGGEAAGGAAAGGEAAGGAAAGGEAAGGEPAGGEPAGGATGRPPPAGWQEAGAERDRDSPLLPDGDLLLGLFAAVRDRIPPDLQRRLAEAIREVLLALRALIDWYLERGDRGPSGPAEVQDIPIL
jgi:hypothetical protein